MRWSRYTLFCAAAAAAAVGTTSAAAHWDRRQASSVSSSASTAASSSSVTSSAATTTISSSSSAVDTAKATSTPPTSSATQTSSAPAPTNSDVEVCHADKKSDIYPFCKPTKDQNVYVDETYYVTWDVDAFRINSTVQITINYVNTTENEGKSAHTSDRVPNKLGFITVRMDKAWLRDKSRNNLTIGLVDYDLATDDHSVKKTGPTISLTKKPIEHYPPPPPSKPNKLGLMVGLPVSLFVVFLIACGLCFGMRKHRRIGLGSIMGRSKGYGGAKSRIERLGGGTRGRRRERSSIRMHDLDDADRYTDDPSRARSDADGFTEVERSQDHAFRTEVPKMKSWK
ncbi:hypothetical protein LOZ66_003817 [Ophidiomyces ophidiicola]|nr:hypothetical protein LOZ65_006332 [Ophidiomyces ophidiicola]KAI1937538.1 hypothetical protein LOZ66_003817 [Ophidiomyces ophidiicola]